MADLDWSTGRARATGSMFKSELTPGVVERHDRKKAREDALEKAYEAVNKRDQNRCRVTGVSLVAGAPDPRVRREHHHLVPRSRARLKRADKRNIVLVSAMAHDLITRGWIVNEGTNADQFIAWHWADLATSKPLRIKRFNPPDGGKGKD
jgi:hypothetical protein